MKLQKWIVDKIKDMFFLYDMDVKSVPSGQQGEDIWLSSFIREKLPISIEAKSRAKLMVYDFYDQAERNSGDYEPVVVLKADRKKPLVLVDFEYFLGLHK